MIKKDGKKLYEYDKTLPKGTEKVKQKGIDGKAKVAFKVKKSNGTIISSENKKTETIVPAQNKIIIKN